MSKFNKRLIFISSALVLTSWVASLASDRAEAQSQTRNFALAGTWQNVTTSQTSNTLSVSGQIYGSIAFDSNACQAQSGGNIALTFGGLTYEIYNTSGTKFSDGSAFAGITQNGNYCATQDDVLAYIHDFSANADISSLPNGDYRIDFATGGQSNPTISGVTAGPLYHSVNFTKVSSCAISSFTCDGNATLAWATSNCSSVKLGSTSVVAVGNTQGTVGTSYTLTADSQTSSTTCPAPVLTTTGGGSQTVAPGSTVSLPSFNFSNTGQSGSVIRYQNCEPVGTNGITPLLPYDCPPPKDLIAP